MFQMSAQGICDQRVTLPALFAEFLKVSLCSFGGGLVGTPFGHRPTALDE